MSAFVFGSNRAHISKCSSFDCNIRVTTRFLPEGEDYEAGDDENCGEHGEHEVAGFPPTGVVEHFGRLENKNRQEWVRV